mgnify:CR=1 FL=1
MHLASKYTKQELENKFASDFSNLTFPLLAEIYFLENDFNRARKVCEIGLQTNSDNLDAQYILAKIELLEDNTIKAERILKNIYQLNPHSIKSIKLLIEVRDFLHRSKNETKKLVDFLLLNVPDDIFANQWLTNNKNKFHNYNAEITKAPIFKINSNINSITFYQVLKKQRYYQQAENVLNDLKVTKKIKKDFYKKESQKLKKLLNK